MLTKRSTKYIGMEVATTIILKTNRQNYIRWAEGSTKCSLGQAFLEKTVIDHCVRRLFPQNFLES